MDLDTILREIGQFGRYQVYVFFLLFFPMVFSTIGTFSYIFTTGDIKYRCLITECEGNDSTKFQNPWLEWAIPKSAEENPDLCLRYKAAENISQVNCSKETFSPRETEKCHSFVFENDENTITKEFNLLCSENKWKRTIIGTLSTVAQFIAMPVTGLISDRYGRKALILGSVLFSSIFGTLRSFSTSYDQFIIFEMLDAMSYSGVYSAVYIFGIEILGPERRGIGGAILSIFSSTGGIILGVIVWLVHDWRNYLRIIYMPGFLFVLYFWIFPESIRWSMAHGKSKEVVEMLSQISLVNKKPFSEDIKDYLRKMAVVQCIVVEKDVKHLSEPDDSASSLRTVIASKTMVFRVLNCCFCWTTHTFVYYGLSLASVLISGDKYINFILVCAIEIPGYLLSWVLVDRLGRKSLMFFGLIISGITCIAFHFVSEGSVLIKLLLFLSGKLAIAISFASLYVLASEFYPTKLRNTLLGLSSTIGRIGSMVAPQTALIAEIIDPFLVFGATSLLAGILGLYFPETMNCKLPDTVEEAENMGKSNKESIKIRETRLQSCTDTD